MKRNLACGIFVVLLLVGRSEGEEITKPEVLTLLRKATDQYEYVERFDFRVSLSCPEMEQVVAERLAFLPIPISVQPQIELLSDNGQQTLRPVLVGESEEVQKMVEQLCRSSVRFGTLLAMAERCNAWPSFFRTIPDATPIDMIQADENTLEFEISGLSEPFQQKIVRSCRVKLNRRAALFEVTVLDFGQSRTMEILWKFRDAQLPDAPQKLRVLDRMEVRQTAFQGDKQQLPERFALIFGEYQFLSAAESAAKTAARAAAEAKLSKLRADLQRCGLPESKASQLRFKREGTLDLDLRGLPLNDLSFLAGLPLSSLLVNTGTVDNVSALTNMPLLKLELVCIPLRDLSPLHGLPLTELRLWNTGVTNLAPLAGMPLEVLAIDGRPVSDLAPLRGMPLRELLASSTLVDDLSPLAGMKLENLRVSDRDNRLKDISVLRGMTSLKRANFFGAKGLRDLHPLEGCVNLEELLLPPNAGDIEFLRQLPNLKRLSRQKSKDSWSSDSTAEEFWKNFGQEPKFRGGLCQSGASLEEADKAVIIMNDGLLELDLSQLPITNIVFLAGQPVQRLKLRNTKVTDITPLRGAPLEYLNLTASPVGDVSALAECPKLKWLSLSATRVTDVRPLLGLRLTHLSVNAGLIKDVSPLAACTTLETIHLPDGATGVEALRRLPNLKRLSYKWDMGQLQPAQTAEEFWQQHDAAQNKK
jgi:Leucine-rich repeat (LRR) protein